MSRILIRNDTSRGSDTEITKIVAIVVEKYKQNSLGEKRVYAFRYWYDAATSTAHWSDWKSKDCDAVVTTEKVTIFNQTFDCIVVWVSDSE